MRLKPGVKLLGLQPQMVVAMQVAISLWFERGLELTITSCTDGEHGKGSLHFKGLALDIRTRDIPESLNVELLREELAHDLGDEFDVVLEHNHFHVEWDPDK